MRLTIAHFSPALAISLLFAPPHKCSLFSLTVSLCRTRESRTLVVAAEKRLEQVTHTAQERHERLKALHAKLESVGFNKSSRGVWDLDTYANLRDRAQRLKSANDEKDSANRTLKDEIDGLKQKITISRATHCEHNARQEVGVGALNRPHRRLIRRVPCV